MLSHLAVDAQLVQQQQQQQQQQPEQQQLFTQVHQTRGTRAFRPIQVGNLLFVYWAQRYSSEKMRRFCTLTGITPEYVQSGELFGVTLYETFDTMGRSSMQPIQYWSDPRFAHFPWAQLRALVADSFNECFPVVYLRSMLNDLTLYLRPLLPSASDSFADDIAAQLELSLRM